jgi:hypothetical protein
MSRSSASASKDYQKNNQMKLYPCDICKKNTIEPNVEIFTQNLRVFFP